MLGALKVDANKGGLDSAPTHDKVEEEDKEEKKKMKYDTRSFSRNSIRSARRRSGPSILMM